jgi:hypothetical protein
MQHKIAGGGHKDLGDEKKEPSVCEREERGRDSAYGHQLESVRTLRSRRNEDLGGECHGRTNGIASVVKRSSG